ncbi:MAG: hypothetical protein LBV08_09805 [Clostridiales bacterium]|jgi:hypothetical protein|nr:hypothetical protein [Clostridiales bacterium]
MLILVAGFEAIEKRQALIESFTFGVVVEDKNEYMDIMLNILFSREDLKNIISFEKMDAETAAKKLKDGLIPCYILIEEGFTESVMTGENKNIVFSGDPSYRLKYNIGEALVKAGAAFLTSSQSGIYSTLDYAYKYGIQHNVIQEEIVMAINLEFGKALISYKDYFDTELINPFGDYPLKTHYYYSALIFMAIVCVAPVAGGAKKIFAPEVLDRLKVLGFDYYKIYSMAYLACLIIIFALLLPLFMVFNYKIFFLAVMLSSLAIFTSAMFKGAAPQGLFIFSMALIMLFISGGAIPKGVLPGFINKLSFLAVNEYFIYEGLKTGLILYTTAFFTILNGIALGSFRFGGGG